MKEMKKFLLPLLFVGLLLTACNQPTSTAPSGGEGGGEGGGETTETETFSVDMSDLTITNNVQANTNFEQFKGSLLPICQAATNKITDLSTTGSVNLIKKPLLNGDNILALSLSSQSNGGTLTFSFSESLVSLKIYASAYYSYALSGDPNNPTPVTDGYNTIQVDRQEAWVVDPYDLDNKSAPRVPKEFTINSNSVTLSGVASQRAYIFKLDFTFNK